ncbi:MAG: hypothetical protein ACRCWI_00010 [Brevinema sp.]
MIFKNDHVHGKVYLTDINSKIEYELPGILQQISVGGSINISSNEPLSYQDKTISISLLLQNTINPLTTENANNVYEILAQLESLFKKEENAEPVQYTITNYHLNSRKINTVIFQTLFSEEGNSSDTISAILTFEEYSPITMDEESSI